MKFTLQQLFATGLTLTVAFAMTTGAYAQEVADNEAPAVEKQPEAADEPSIDDLLGLEDDETKKEPNADEPEADGPGETDPKLTRDLDKALTGQQAADQFAQAIEEMEEVAIRLGDESDPGIDTRRMQDEIILKLEQIIASAEKTKSQQKPKPGQGQPQQQARQADKQQGQQQGQQEGDKPGEQQGQEGEQQGQKPGEQEGDQQGQGEGQGEQQGEQEGQQEGQQAGGQQSGQNAGSRGDVRNEELSMKDLREGEWGNLPPRLRDELAESLSETFNPVYRSATEAFYRRIAEISQQQAEEGKE
ncbi:MAG: hypothetical protein AAGI37_12915 [Planctomycetota bacterium]